MSAILELENLNYSYIDGGYERQILQDLSYSFEEKQFYTILGPSGSGKTTLLSLVAGLDTPKSGRILTLDDDSTERLRLWLAAQPGAECVNNILGDFLSKTISLPVEPAERG